MPQLANAPTNPGLAALFNVPVPAAPVAPTTGVDDPVDFPEPLPEDKRKRPENPPPDPAPVPPAPDSVPPVAEPKKEALLSRLAPDFAAQLKAPAPSAPIADPATDMPEKAPDWAKTPKQQDDYQKWRKSHMELHRQIQTLEARVASAAPAAAPEEFETTKSLLAETQKQLDDATARLERTDLMASPRFQKQFMDPHNKVLAKAQGIVKDAGGDIAAFTNALALQGLPRAERLDEIRAAIPSETMRGQLDLLIRDIDDKRVEINEQLQNARTTAAEQRKQDLIEKQRNGEKSVSEMKSLLGAARKSLLEEAGWSILQKSNDPNFKWWNEDIDRADAASEEILFRGGPDQAALAAVLAPHALRLHTLLGNTQEALRAANDEIAELKGASPRMTQERTAPKGEVEGFAETDILTRMQRGDYKTRK